MGSSTSKVRDEIKRQEDAQKEKEEEAARTVDLLENLLDAKEAQFTSELTTLTVADRRVPIDTIVKQRSLKQVNVSSTPSSALTGAVNDLFGGNFLNSLKGIVMVALSTVLGSTSGGSKEIRSYQILFLYNSIVRIDYFLYGYTIASSGLIDRVKNAVCFSCTFSTVDLLKVGSEVFTFLLGEAADRSTRYLYSRKYTLQFEMRKLKSDIDLSGDTFLKNTQFDVGEVLGLIKFRYQEELSEEELSTVDKAAVGSAESSIDDATKRSLFTLFQKYLTIEIESYAEISDLIAKEQKESLNELADIYSRVAELRSKLVSASAQ